VSDPQNSDWTEHAAKEGAAVSADPGESGDVIDTGGASADATSAPTAVPPETEPQVDAAERAPHHLITD
jgi:hypothetical protein